VFRLFSSWLCRAEEVEAKTSQVTTFHHSKLNSDRLIGLCLHQGRFVCWWQEQTKAQHEKLVKQQKIIIGTQLLLVFESFVFANAS
jgi:hypothetical protein